MQSAFLEATRQWTLAVPTVSAFIASLVRDFPDRDDVLQETAVAVMNSFHRYNPSRPFVGWALGIARNQVRLHYRRKNREFLAFDSDALNALVIAFEESNRDQRRSDVLKDCVASLDEESRELCRLRYESDLKPAAIGERLGMAANTVAKSLQRIRERLRDCVERKTTAPEAGT